MGIKKGDWVGLMLGNVPDFAILGLALSKVGATVVPLDPTTGQRDLGLIMDTAPLRALITRPRGGVETQQPAPPSASGRLENLESRRRLQGTLLTCSIYTKPPGATPEPAALVLYTNDSNGNPKGVLRTDENLEAAAVQTARALEVTADDRILTTVPLFHSYGFDCGLALALRFGATLYLEDEVAPKRIVKLLREQEINVLPGTPGLYAGLAKLPTAKALKVKKPRYLSAGSPLSEATAEAFKNRWGIRIVPLYHTTETSTIAVDKKEPRPGSAGKVIEGVEARIGNGKVPVGEDGAIWIRGKAIAQRAIPMPRARIGTAVGGLDDKGWLRTGDVGHFDKTGRIYLSGREDQLVKVDGKRVALGEVQECLESFSKVQQALVRVITDPLGGPMVVASVVVFGKCGAEEIIDHCAKNLAPYKVPRRIEFCETLPSVA
ncbi:MAG: AMP-dependent synthetase and ligase [Myxococcales bacterium]|nr:AMP-dependent synthetase and ligase [Myxococcales bacterium]